MDRVSIFNPRLHAAVLALISAVAGGCTEGDRVIAVQNSSQAGGAGGGSGSGGVSEGVAVSKAGESLLSDVGLTSVALGGYLNGESFQQDAIVTYQGYQYAAFWNNQRHVVLARRALPAGAWSTIEFTDYSTVQNVAINTISLGICPGDGTLHLSFDNDRVSALRYRRSVTGLADAGSGVPWASSSFSKVTSELVTGAGVQNPGLPRFISAPSGNLLFEASISSSNGGTDETLWEYSGGERAWTQIGRFIAGIEDAATTYAHGLSYTRGGRRLHLAWCWRDDSTTPSSNHDLLYIYSDDDGRTWQNGDGAVVAKSGSSAVTKTSPGIKAWTIAQKRGLINSEHMVVSSSGEVHVLLSHLPDSEADDATFTAAREKSHFFHYVRDASGRWTRGDLGLPALETFRGKLALAASGNVYAVLPDLRIAAASASSGYGDWALLDDTESGRFFSDPLIDSGRLASEDVLSIFYPQKASPNLYVLDYALR